MKKLIIATAVSVLALSGAAAANAQAPGQMYGSVGVQGTDNDSTNTDLNSVNVRVGTRLNQNFGVEADASFGTGEDQGPGGDYRLTNKWGVYGVGYVPVSERFDLIGRVGVSDTDLKAPGIAGKLEQGTALDYGVGAQYHMDQGYALRADYTKSDFQNDKGEASTATVSLVKKF
jgi:opacity protein-like surface antigen